MADEQITTEDLRPVEEAGRPDDRTDDERHDERGASALHAVDLLQRLTV